MANEPEEVELWPLVMGCKSPKDFRRLFKEAKANYDALVKLLNEQPQSVTVLHHFGARMNAIGIIRGAQFGTSISRDYGGTIADSMLKHSSVAKLLTQTPKATTKEVCRALDRVNEPLPWPELRREDRFWNRWATNSTVKMAISNARKAALQRLSDEEWLSVIKGVGDEGSIFSKFQIRKRKIVPHVK
jgi:hypothetical protein